MSLVTEILLLTAGITFLAVTALWAIATKIKDISIIDMYWGAGFAVIAWAALLWTDYRPLNVILLMALPTIWATRYSVHVISRNWGHGEDKRYAQMRDKRDPAGFAFWSYWSVYLFQGWAQWFVALPVIVGIAHAPTTAGPLAFLGVLVWIVGFLFETIGDEQLKRYKQQEDRGPIMDWGLWKYTRHPNYFGNAVMWWGIWLIACESDWGWITFVGPLFMTWSLRYFSGVKFLEEQMEGREGWDEYKEKTSVFIPMPPKG